MGDLFLSYSHKDKGFIRLLAFDLKAAGIEVWYDDEIDPFERHPKRIADALEAASYVGACLSQSSVPSNWVRTEIEIAIAKEINENRIIVLPFLIQDCQIPILLLNKVFIDFRSPVMYERAFRDILLRIKPEVLPDDDSVQSLLVVDVERTGFLVKAATQPGGAESEGWVRDWIMGYLKGTRTDRLDGAERYWIYRAAGDIGGSEAEALLRGGLLDEDELARQGAREGLEKMRIIV